MTEILLSSQQKTECMLIKTKAIVLHSLKYGDASVIVEMFTEQNGRQAFAVRIPKTSKAKVKKQYFQPLTILDIEYDYRQKTDLQRLRDVRIAMPFSSVPFDPVKMSVVLFLAEFLHYVTRGEQQNIPLYQYIENSLEWLDACDGGFANFHLVFTMRLARFLGFFPNLEDYVDGCCFDLRSASFVIMPPLHSDFLKPQEAARVNQLMRMNYETMRLFKMSHADRNQITDVIMRYYRQHVPQMPELRSLEIIRELWR